MNTFGNSIFTLLILLTSLTFCQTRARQNVTPAAEEVNRPLPSYLDFVAPHPQEVLSLAAYQQGLHYPGSSNPAESQEYGRNRICLELRPTAPLLEPGDHFVLYPDEGDYLPERVTAYVDNQEIERQDEVSSLPVRFDLYNNDGEIIASAPALQLFCWAVELEPGTHIAAVEFQRTSGIVVTYKWSFEITEQ